MTAAAPLYSKRFIYELTIDNGEQECYLGDFSCHIQRWDYADKQNPSVPKGENQETIGLLPQHGKLYISW